MMKWLTEDARLACDHGGRVGNKPSQELVTIDGRKVLVDNDPEGRSISTCPNLNPTAGIKPCKTTLKVIEGYSAFVTIDGHAVCLDTVRGLTDGTPPGTVNYKVLSPGQSLLDALG
jgi:hypothetical protein